MKHCTIQDSNYEGQVYTLDTMETWSRTATRPPSDTKSPILQKKNIVEKKRSLQFQSMEHKVIW